MDMLITLNVFCFVPTIRRSMAYHTPVFDRVLGIKGHGDYISPGKHFYPSATVVFVVLHLVIPLMYCDQREALEKVDERRDWRNSCVIDEC